MMSVELTLRFRSPQEVLTLIEVVGMALDEAHDGLADDTDFAADVTQLEELNGALWKCLEQAGFSRVKNGPNIEVWYAGEPVKWEPSVEGVVGQVKKWLHV